MRRVYVAPVIYRWGGEEIKTSYGHFIVDGSSESSGVLLVYDELETFQRKHPDLEPLVLKVLEDGNHNG